MGFTSQTHDGGCISFIMATLLTPVKYRHGIIKLTSASIHSHLSFQLTPHLSFLIFFHLLFIIIFGNPLHHHRYLLSSMFIVIGMPLHHRHQYFRLFPFFRLLFIHIPILKNTVACQMPSKRAKKSLKDLFLMRYSEFCFQSGGLICGVC